MRRLVRRRRLADPVMIIISRRPRAFRANAAGAPFTADASYHEIPFDEPMQGRAAIEAYWSRVTATQSDALYL